MNTHSGQWVWTAAGNLTLGDELLLASGNKIKVKRIHKKQFAKEVKVYNFEVEDYHTYFVAESKIWVHNTCSVDPSKGKSKLRYLLKETDVDLRDTDITFSNALDLAFENTRLNKADFEVTKWGKNKYGKSFPVEWRASNGAEVSVDFAHYNIDTNGNWITGPDAPHIGWQTGGKRSNGGAKRGHLIIDSGAVRKIGVEENVEYK